MGTSVGQIDLDLELNQRNFNSQLRGIERTAKRAGLTIAAAFGVKKLIDFGRQCLKLGSDLAEVQNVVDVAFPKMNKRIDEFAKNAITKFGLSETMAKQFTGTFGAMSRSFGFTEKAAAQMSTTLTGLAGDVASFYNISQDMAYTKLKSVFTGETESLKDLGVVMTQTALDAFALANGFGKTTKKMSEAEKVALRYAFVQDKLKFAMGDFARTSDSWANQTRILSLQFDSLKATLGQGLINVLTPVIKVINTLMGKLIQLANVFKSFTEMITGKSGAVTEMNGVADAAANAADSTGALSDSAKSAAKSAKDAQKSLMGFDEINKLDDKSNVGNSDMGAVPTIDIGKMEKGKGVLDKFDKQLNKLKKALQPTIDAFERFGNSLKPIKDFTGKTLIDFYNLFLKPVGKWTFGEGIPRLLDAISNLWSKVDWTKLNKALAVFYKALSKFTIGIGEGLLQFIETLSDILSPIIAFLVSKLADALKYLGEVIDNMPQESIERLGYGLGALLTSLLIADAMGKTANILLKLGTALKRFGVGLTTVMAVNPTLISVMFADIATSIDAWISEKVVEKFGDLGGLILENISVGGFGALVGFSFGGLPGAIVGALAGLIINAVVQGDWKDVLGFILSEFFNFDLAKRFIDEMMGNFKSLGEALAKGDLVEVGKNLVLGLFHGISAGISFLIEPICDLFQSITDGIMSLFGIHSPSTVFAEMGVNLIKGLLNGIKSLIDTVLKPFKDLWNNIKNIFANVGTWFGNKFTLAWSGIKNAFSGAGTFFSGVWTNIKNAFPGVKDWFKGTFSDAWDSVRGIFDGTKNVVGTKQTGVAEKSSRSRESLRSRLPMLANGGFVKRNTPQLAVIGDNRRYGEVVAPENKMEEMASQAARKVLAEFSGGSDSNFSGNLTVEVHTH